jgi:hypothetical protein
LSIFSFFRRRRKKRERIDPFTLTDPWRSFVQDAQQAENRFARIVETVAEGPLRERLGDISQRVHEGLLACWRIAQSGHHLHKMVLQVADTDSESVTRMRTRERETRDKLAALTHNLDEAVARAAELATGQYAGIDAIADDVETVVGDLEALRQALAEINPA